MDGRTRAALERRLTRFDAACTEMAFRGARHPDDHEAAVEEYESARASIVKFVEECVAPRRAHKEKRR